MSFVSNWRECFCKDPKKAIRFSKEHSRRGLYELLQQAARQVAEENGSVILNIGSGGEIQRILEEEGVSVTSVDIDPERKPDVVASITDLAQFEDESVSHVFCMEVLEHVDQPWKGVEEMRRVLRPGGTVVGSTPFLLGLHDRPYDYYRFTKYGLKTT